MAQENGELVFVRGCELWFCRDLVNKETDFFLPSLEVSP